MNERTEFVRSDTPDPRVGAFNVTDVSAIRPHMDISSAWPYLGTNNSALKGTVLNRSLSEDLQWMPSAPGLHDNPMSQYGSGNFKHKRHWQSDDRFLDDTPPCKVRINEEKVSQQFFSMSLYSDNLAAGTASMSSATNTPTNTVSAMWDRYHDLEEKLDTSGDIDIDEGVDMGGELDSSSSADSTQEPLLHLSPDLKFKLHANNSLPQILVPKPCKEVVLWQPSGVEVIKGSVKESATSMAADEDVKARKKKTATRTLSPNICLLAVPDVRPDTPPPNTRASPLSHDIPVCFVEEPNNDSEMEMQ